MWLHLIHRKSGLNLPAPEEPFRPAFFSGNQSLAASASFVIAALTGGLSGIIFEVPRGYVQVP